MGACCTRMKPKPFARLRQFVQDRKERRKEKRRQIELDRLRRESAAVLSALTPRVLSPFSGAPSTHSSLASTSIILSTVGSGHSLHCSDSDIINSDAVGSNSSADIGLKDWSFLSRQARNGDDSDDSDDSDGSDGEGHPLGLARASCNLLLSTSSDVAPDNDDTDEDMCTISLRLRRYVSEQSEICKTSAVADEAHHGAFHRGASLTATVAKKILPTIPENDILVNRDNVSQPLPTARPERGQGDVSDDFNLPGFIP